MARLLFSENAAELSQEPAVQEASANRYPVFRNIRNKSALRILPVSYIGAIWHLVSSLDFIVLNTLLTLYFLFLCGRYKVHLTDLCLNSGSDPWDRGLSTPYHTVGLPLRVLKSLEAMEHCRSIRNSGSALVASLFTEHFCWPYSASWLVDPDQCLVSGIGNLSFSQKLYTAQGLGSTHPWIYFLYAS